MTKKFVLRGQNIHSRLIDHITKSKIENLIRKDYKKGDMIDVRDLSGGRGFYLAKILNIERYYYNYNDDEKNKLKDIDKKLKCVVITVGYRYQGEEYEDIIKIDLKKDRFFNVICDCKERCWTIDGDMNNEFPNHHRIAFGNTQTTIGKTLNGTCTVYSRRHNKMMILGCNINDSSRNSLRYFWYGMYCKYINSNVLVYNGLIVKQLTKQQEILDLIINGYIRRWENIFENIQVPLVLHGIIKKYYFIVNDTHWHVEENSSVVRSILHNVTPNCGYTLINDENDILFFGKKNSVCLFDIGKSELVRLEHIKYPFMSSCNAVYCKNSQRIYLFSNDHDGPHYWAPLSVFVK